MSLSQDLQEREALQQGMAVSTEHDNEVVAESEAQAHLQELHYLRQDNPPQYPLAPTHHLPPPHPLPRPAADKTFSPPPSIISNKTLICIPGIIMRWCRINHLGAVIHL